MYYCRIGTITSIASKPSSSSSPVYQLYPPSSHGAVPSSADRPPSPLLSQLSASNPNSFPPPSSEKLLLLRHRRERVEEVDSLTMYKYYKQQLPCVSLYFLPALYTRWENLRGVRRNRLPTADGKTSGVPIQSEACHNFPFFIQAFFSFFVSFF